MKSPAKSTEKATLERVCKNCLKKLSQKKNPIPTVSEAKSLMVGPMNVSAANSIPEEAEGSQVSQCEATPAFTENAIDSTPSELSNDVASVAPAVSVQYLPFPWERHEVNGELYYFNPVTEQSVWSYDEIPRGVPPGPWEVHRTDEGETYYFHPETEQSVWSLEETGYIAF